MPSSSVSHVICSAALIVVIFSIGIYYGYVVDNIWTDMTRRELKEISDYVSNSLSNLYLLANSTNCDAQLEKTLDLPSNVRDSTYVVQIVYDASDRSAQKIETYLEGKSWISANSWILPGLKVEGQNQVRSSEKAVIAGCLRNCTGVYVWIE